MYKVDDCFSRITKFYNFSLKERYKILIKKINISKKNLLPLLPLTGLNLLYSNFMIENSIGVFGMPIGIVLNFIVDDKPVIIPMATEEPSIIAACSYIGYIVGKNRGFYTKVNRPIMIGQMQITKLKNIYKKRNIIDMHNILLMKLINKNCYTMVKRGGGCINIKTFIVTSSVNKYHMIYDDYNAMLIIHFIIDSRNSMGANLVNESIEYITPFIKKLISSNIGIRIISNLAQQRLARAWCNIPYKFLSKKNNINDGRNIAKKILEAYKFAVRDPYRACTHNKGIMNGIDSIAITTGNDWRALEAGAHAYASRTGKYTSLTTYAINDIYKILKCYIEIPIAIGVIGGSTKIHPTVLTVQEILGIFSQNTIKLSGLMASVGLAQNLAALKALANEGIQKGHMLLHSKKIKIN